MITRPAAGLDGCPDGWIVVLEQGDGSVTGRIARHFANAIRDLPDDTTVAVDIPIGLTESGQRDCDRVARRLLRWPRRCSVFSAPIRGVLGLDDYREACDAHRGIDGRGMSRQSFAIMDRIEEVDRVLRCGLPALRERVVEAHPEVSFCIWNDLVPMEHGKKKRAGREERRRLIDAVWPGAVDRVRSELDAAEARFGIDDLYDAFAALWTARRIRDGKAWALPPEPPIDRHGLPMRIVG